jgi:nickel-dependent lactate racemase
MLLFQRGSAAERINDSDLESALLATLENVGTKKRILILPPDGTRFHSRAGDLTRFAYRFFGKRVKAILPALGTHSAMTPQEIQRMFGDIPLSLFKVHDWRKDIVTLGEVPSDFVAEVSKGVVSYPWPAQVNKEIALGEYDLILSIGQVVPHEVVGMANHNKNIFVGTGGPEGINKSHFLGAAYGMERIMGRAKTPVRDVLNFASDHFARHLPILYVQTVIARDKDGSHAVRGLYAGFDDECFLKAAELSLQVNFCMLEQPLRKVVVYLDPAEFKSTWLGNKAIYRTRMAMADGGELLILAPGLKEFGEDPEMDRLIRKYGYRGTQQVLEATAKEKELQSNLGAAAHLIHGSTEGRVSVTYCPGHLSKEEVESAGFRFEELQKMMKRYDPSQLADGWNRVDHEDIFFISNPALGLWAWKDRFC